MFTKAQVSTPNNFLLVTNVLLNYYYMRIDPLEWKSRNSNLNAMELKEQGTDWFLGLAWYERQFMGNPKPFFFVATGICTDISAFYIPNDFGQPTPFSLHPFISHYEWHICLTGNTPHEKKRETKIACRREKTWEEF